jgi:hypothetical protein
MLLRIATSSGSTLLLKAANSRVGSSTLAPISGPPGLNADQPMKGRHGWI